MKLDDLKRYFDKAYFANQVTREKAANDYVFYWVTQWDDSKLNDQLAYRGEFNIMRKGGRQIMADLRANPIQPDFHPKDEGRQDDAEVMDKFYRAVDREITSEEAYTNAQQDQVVCGMGAWRLYTEYKSNAIGDMRQVIKREYIPQGNNTVFFDPNANSLSKVEAKYCAVLYSYSEDGYKDLVEELTGERPTEVVKSDFKNPERDNGFFWFGSNEEIYVVRFYKKEKVKDTVLFLEDPTGMDLTLYKSQIEEDYQEMLDNGFKVLAEKEITRTRIREYIASGKEILNGEIVDGERVGELIAGEYIPIIPLYGEHVANIQGQEHWEGVTRLAKDPQRLRNFQLSYLADILSQSPRRKPIFHPEQIQGYEHMYDVSGADNNYPYLYMNSADASGNPLPAGAVGELPEPTIPPALLQGLGETRLAIDDVLNSGTASDVTDLDLSGEAVAKAQSRIDMQSYVYQANMKIAKRTDALCFASIASEVMDTPQSVVVESKDGSRTTIELMRTIYDPDKGEVKTLNDITNVEFEVYTDIGTSYQTQKEQTINKLSNLYASLGENEQEKNIILHTLIQAMPGVEMSALKDYSRKQMVLRGYVEPETEEEIAMLQQSQQQQPDPVMVAAMAEQEKARADQANAQVNMFKAQSDAQYKSAQTILKEKELNIKEAEARIDAAKTGADIEKTLAETRDINIDSQSKILGGLGFGAS